MADIPADAERLLKPFELGLRVAQGRRRAKISQAAFAQKLGVSRKTVSDLERGTAEHVSLKTAMAALSLATGMSSPHALATVCVTASLVSVALCY